MDVLYKLLGIPDAYRVEYDIPAKKLFSENEEVLRSASRITLIASLKLAEGLSNANVEFRFEEILVLHIESLNNDLFFDTMRIVFNSIKYPVLVVQQYQAKIRLVACNYTPGKIDSEKNIIGTPIFSSWIFSDDLSEKAERCLAEIKNAWQESDAKTAYLKIHGAVSCAQPINVTKNHARGIICYLGPISSSAADKMLLECTPYIKKQVTTGGTRYKPKKASTIIYRYDMEDLWHSLHNNPITQKSLELRRIRNVDELLYYSDVHLYPDE